MERRDKQIQSVNNVLELGKIMHSNNSIEHLGNTKYFKMIAINIIIVVVVNNQRKNVKRHSSHYSFRIQLTFFL